MKEIYFSPTGTTKTIVNEITKYFSLNKEEYDLKVAEGFEDIKNGKTFSNEEMALKIEQLKKS